MISKLFVFLGILFLAFGVYFVWERNNPQRLSFNNLVVKKTATPPVLPGFRLIIPAQGINLPILPATITNNVWSDTKRGVSYLSSTPLPGKLGNSVIYGHNWGNLLGSLTQTKPGDKVLVQLADGKKIPYTFQFTSVVTPNDTHILANTSDYRLTIYTCTGFLDSRRFVATAIKDP